jgi:hemerythrin
VLRFKDTAGIVGKGSAAFYPANDPACRSAKIFRRDRDNWRKMARRRFGGLQIVFAPKRENASESPSLFNAIRHWQKFMSMTPAYPKAFWSEAIEVGLPAIDGQHKRLFDLAASFRGEGDQIRVMKTLATLCDYTNTHLREEEAMLQAIAYPDLSEHKQHHIRFRRMLHDFLEDSRRMTLDEIADRAEALINGWFYQHILTVDADYVPAVKAYEARKHALALARPPLSVARDTGWPGFSSDGLNPAYNPLPDACC